MPEAGIKQVIAQRLQISQYNDFAMLNSIGGECAGAVSLLPSGETPTVKPGFRKLNEEELHKVIIDLPRRPLMAGVEGMRLSLAGAQNKLPVFMENNRIFIASGNAPSSHILKPAIKDLEDTVGGENRPSWIQQRHWERFGEAVAIKPRLVLKTLQDMATSIMPPAQNIAAEFRKIYGTFPIIEKILAIIEKRAKAV